MINEYLWLCYINLFDMRVPPKLALIILCSFYPIAYYAWVKQIKNSWVQLQQNRSKMISFTATPTLSTLNQDVIANNLLHSTSINSSNKLQYYQQSQLLQLSDLSIYKQIRFIIVDQELPLQEMMTNELQPFNNIKKDGSVLLICSGSGRISKKSDNLVFVVGDTQVFEVKHSKILQKNLFSLGFTLRSLIEVRRNFPNGILNFPLDPKIKLRMQYVRQRNIDENIGEDDWRSEKESFVKCLQLKCSTLKAYFSEQQISHRQCQVIKREAIMPKYDQSEEDLVLIQIEEMTRGEIKSTKGDYLYTRTRIQQSEAFEVLIQEQ